MKTCCCGREIAHYLNYCGWDCSVDSAKKAGGVVHTPNGLPIMCIRHDNLMLECEHGDHPDYKFPVEVEYVGNDPAEEFAIIGPNGPVEQSREELERWMTETHAFIYADDSIALTLYECTYALWSLSDGRILHGHAKKLGEWKLTDNSLNKIREMKR